jgi:hypothetical protein
MNQEKLLREYIKRTLSEDYYGGEGGFSTDYHTAAGALAPGRFGSGEDLYSTFIRPFVDIFKVAVGKTKEVAIATKTLLSVALQTVLTTIFPIFETNYVKTFEDYEDDIKEVKNEYKEVYDRLLSSDVFSGDAAFLAFLASPALASAFLVGKKAPSVIKDTLSVVTGGFSDDVYRSIKKGSSETESWLLGGKGKKSRVGEGRLLEAEASGTRITPEKILKSKVFLSKISESPKLKEMQKVAQRTYRETLQKIYKQAEDVLKNAKTIEDIEKIAKKPIKDIEKLKGLQGQERDKAEKLLITGIRKSMKEYYVKKLKEQVDSVV